MTSQTAISHALTLPSGAALKNRLVKSAMSEALADEHNNPTEALINLFGRWSQGGAGLLITGNTSMDRGHLEHAGNVVLDDKTDLQAMARLATAAKSGGARALVQLAHAGRQTPQAINPSPLSLSDRQLDLPGYGPPKIATEEELQSIIDRYADSALLAKEVGFDGIQIHAAHGYLLSSSLSPLINTRQDQWGGSLENRARLPLSVVRRVREAVGTDFIVAVKLNSSDFQKGGFDQADSLAVARMLEAEGVDFIEISGGNFETPVAYSHQSQKESTKVREAYFLDYASAIRPALSIPVMVTGGFRSLEVMNQALSEGATDLIGMGRPYIIDPDFPAKLLDGRLSAAPAVEREFPPASDLPRGAVLNWFCDQLMRQATDGKGDLSLSAEAGHQHYLDDIERATQRLLAARGRG